ncbi:hypothetical protein K402DRAFT_403014 [Aulographum hederae CBS 113979]|uniref:Uncharacterized protein n=1 Tax=Aulographum hederae CBS 113979 TaxID=1176131 RepID=A0A6G1H5V2_9PEZI|nr:hypothetical protein K402DRAFT_403014 [Aulographum hederae CBS 113979]
MCQTSRHHSLTCRHSWLILTVPCRRRRNFSNCPMWQDGATTLVCTLPPYESQQTWTDGCPRCYYKHYDRKYCKIIKSERRGWHFGLDPGAPSMGTGRNHRGSRTDLCAVM